MSDDDEAPLDPVRVTLFVLFLAGLGFGAYRLYIGRKAVAAVKEASKDYRKLFPSRADEVPEPVVKQTAATTPAASSMMLQIDEDMKTPKPQPKTLPAPQTAPVAAAPAPVPVKTAPAKAVQKPIPQARLNSGAFSRLNGGSGVGFSGGSAGGGGAPTAGAPGADAKPGEMPAMPPGMDLSKIPGMPAGGIPGMPSGDQKK